jgi:subtilase family serine protease
MTPHALRVAYGIEPLIERGYTGKGQTVIDIVSFGSPTLQQDVNAFDNYYHLPAITIQIISPLNEKESDPNGDKSGWAGETTLDVEVIHALAPQANIAVLVSPVAETEGTVGLPEFRQLMQYALDHHLGNIVSQSWGASEVTLADAAGQQEIQKWDALYKQATTQTGLSVLTASGDNGSTDYVDMAGKILSKTATTSFAADDPWVTTVGGTLLTRNGGSYSETVWNDNGGGAGGGGFSKFFQEPSYQKTLPSPVQSELNNRRGVPDVSADASPSSGMSIYLSGTWQPIGGTSASTPMWAAIIAIGDQMAGHPLGFLNPGLYKIAQSSSYTQDFHDITTGENSHNNVLGYPAAQGWDASSGLGSPNAEKLLPDLIQALK